MLMKVYYCFYKYKHSSLLYYIGNISRSLFHIMASRSSLGLLTFFLCLNAVGDVTAYVGQDQLELAYMYLW